MGSDKLTSVVSLWLFSRQGLWTPGSGSEGQVRENRHGDVIERMRGDINSITLQGDHKFQKR